MYRKEDAEFLTQGVVPFALARCEKFIPQLVAGYYDKVSQTWAGRKDSRVNCMANNWESGRASFSFCMASCTACR